MEKRMKEFLVKRAKEMNVDLKELNLEGKDDLLLADLYKLSVTLDLPVQYLILCNNGIYNISPRFLNQLIYNNQKDLIKYLISNRMLIVIDKKIYYIDQNPFRTTGAYEQDFVYEELIKYLLNNDLVEYAIKLSNYFLHLKIDTLDRNDINHERLLEYMFYIKEINHSFPDFIGDVYREIDETGKMTIEEKFVEYFEEIEKLILEFQAKGNQYTFTRYNFSYEKNDGIEGSVEFYEFDEIYNEFSVKNREIIENIIIKYGVSNGVRKLY